MLKNWFKFAKTPEVSEFEVAQLSDIDTGVSRREQAKKPRSSLT